MRYLINAISIIMCILWVIYLGHWGNSMWGFWGWLAGGIFFIPLTLYMLFLYVIHGEWINLIISILYIISTLALMIYSAFLNGKYNEQR